MDRLFVDGQVKEFEFQFLNIKIQMIDCKNKRKKTNIYIITQGFGLLQVKLKLKFFLLYFSEALWNYYKRMGWVKMVLKKDSF